MEELHSSRVQVDVITKTENRVKELENALRVEERYVSFSYLQDDHTVFVDWCIDGVLLCRNKVVMSNTISKLERKINELSGQLEEEQKIVTEQKDLVGNLH